MRTPRKALDLTASIALCIVFALTVENLFTGIASISSPRDILLFRIAAFMFMAVIEFSVSYWRRRNFVHSYAIYFTILCMFYASWLDVFDSRYPLLTNGLAVFASSFLTLAVLTTLAYLAKRSSEKDPWISHRKDPNNVR